MCPIPKRTVYHNWGRLECTLPTSFKMPKNSYLLSTRYTLSKNDIKGLFVCFIALRPRSTPIKQKIKHYAIRLNCLLRTFVLTSILFVCLFVLRLNDPVNIFSVKSGRSHRFLGFNLYSR